MNNITTEKIIASLFSVSDKQRAESMQRFFKTGKGEYGEGDIFIGVSVPKQRAVAKLFAAEADKNTIAKLLESPIHEERLTGVFILVEKFKKSIKLKQDKQWVDLYIEKAERMNNWDLVDSSAHLILGRWLEGKDKTLLYEFADAASLWKNRIALISTLHFIRKHDFTDALCLCEKSLTHQHDLIHKASGWMLKEIFEKKPEPVYDFLNQHKSTMPRTMLRIAIEKMPETKRQEYLKK